MSLSAETNETLYYSTEISDDFGKNNKWICPGCDSEVIYHRNVSGLRTQHFVHKTKCPYETEPESEIHINLKRWCYENINADKKYVPDSQFIGDQKPDVLLEINKNKVAIECQCSKISLSNLIERTRKYTEKGIYVLWIFSGEYINPLNIMVIEDYHIKKVSVTEKWLSKIFFRRVYYAVTKNNGFEIVPIHFNPYRKYRQLLSNISPQTFSSNINLWLVKSKEYETEEEFLIARLTDKKWWGESR